VLVVAGDGHAAAAAAFLHLLSQPSAGLCLPLVAFEMAAAAAAAAAVLLVVAAAAALLYLLVVLLPQTSSKQRLVLLLLLLAVTMISSPADAWQVDLQQSQVLGMMQILSLLVVGTQAFEWSPHGAQASVLSEPEPEPVAVQVVVWVSAVQVVVWVAAVHLVDWVVAVQVLLVVVVD
jgi:hypothetical protein